MTQIKKGIEYYEFSDYDHSHTCAVRKIKITGFGKVQGTGVTIQNGKPIRCRLYSRNAGINLVPVVDVPDVQAEAMRRAKIIKQIWTAHYAERAYQFQSAPDGYHIPMTKEARIQIDQQPTVKFLNF